MGLHLFKAPQTSESVRLYRSTVNQSGKQNLDVRKCECDSPTPHVTPHRRRGALPGGVSRSYALPQRGGGARLGRGPGGCLLRGLALHPPERGRLTTVLEKQRARRKVLPVTSPVQVRGAQVCVRCVCLWCACRGRAVPRDTGASCPALQARPARQKLVRAPRAHGAHARTPRAAASTTKAPWPTRPKICSGAQRAAARKWPVASGRWQAAGGKRPCASGRGKVASAAAAWADAST